MPNSISVVVATFNGAKFIEQQLNSVLDQSRLPEEIIVSDDGSNDETISTAKRVLGDRASELGIRFQVVTRPQPLGVAKNFESAARMATEEFIAFADQDDVWERHKLETLAREFAENEDLLLVHSDAILIDDQGRSLGRGLLGSLRATPWERRQLSSRAAIRALIRRNLITGATMMVRRPLVEQAPDVPPGWLHDYWYAVLAASLGASTLNEEALIRYRQHGANQVGARKVGVSDVFRKFAEPQEDFREMQKIRSDAYKELMRSKWPVSDLAKDLIVRRGRHFEKHRRLAARRVLRVIPILTMLLAGDYWRFRRGFLDAVRDLLQPSA